MGDQVGLKSSQKHVLKQVLLPISLRNSFFLKKQTKDNNVQFKDTENILPLNHNSYRAIMSTDPLP